MDRRLAPTLLLLTVFLFLIGFGCVGYGLRQFGTRASQDASAPAKIVEIAPGDGVHQISEKLASAGLITSRFFFEIYVWLHGTGSGLQAGTYELSPHLTMSEIARVVSAGDATSTERTIRILEGWNNAEIAAYLAAQGVVTKDEFLAATGTTDSRRIIPDKSYPFLADKPATLDLEGYLFPDTYQVFADATAADIVEKMLDGFAQKVDTALLEEIRAKGKTVHEVVTIASLLEKEVCYEEDRRMVADLIARRMAADIPLQLDSTINYLTNKSDPTSSAEDLRIQSPYNTYLNKGLPPGPIGNPSLAAIKAAINPLPNDYLYYLNDQNVLCGKTYFAKTLEEHNENKAKYLK